MPSVENGGAHPQKVLLIGGPMHGRLMNFPADQDEYEFVSDKSFLSTVDGWSDWPNNASHIYRLDTALTSALSPRRGQLKLFTHRVLWDSPHQGGFNLIALKTAYDRAKDADEKLQAKQQIVSDRNKEIGDLTDALAEANGQLAEARQRLLGTRCQLEAAAISLATAMDATGVAHPGALRPLQLDE